MSTSSQTDMLDLLEIQAVLLELEGGGVQKRAI